MWNKKYNLNRQTGFVTWLRAFAVICILLCHYVSESKNIYIQMTAQVFNIGVNWIVNTFLDNFFKVVFLVLYGCLISQRGMYSVMVVPVYIIP